MMKLFKSIFCTSLITLAQANPLIDSFAKLPIPTKNSTSFEKWTYDTALLTTNYCWKQRYGTEPLPTILSQAKIHQSGSWELPTKGTELCNSLEEEGINPVCTSATLWIKNGINESTLSVNYLKVSRENSQNFVVEGTLACYLNHKKVQKQYFVPQFTWEWTIQPTSKSIMTPAGAKQQTIGNILITAPNTKDLSGQIYQEPKIVVVFD